MNSTILSHTNSSWYFLLNGDITMIDLVQSTLSLIITICIAVKVFDISSFRKSIREKRNKQKKDKEKKEFERIKMLISSLQNNEDVSSLKMTDSSEGEEKVDSGVMKIARKKSKKRPSPPTDAGQQV